jgi:lipopolysaccharide/colanic/teichoic acid biosynthesis glycosyltransferase
LLNAYSFFIGTVYYKLVRNVIEACTTCNPVDIAVKPLLAYNGARIWWKTVDFMGRYKFYRAIVKRAMDICLSAVAIVVLSIPMLVVAALVSKRLGHPVLFRQERPGKDSKIFTMYKFRTMTDAVDVDGNLLPDEERLTPFGKKLRATSLDELPELFNILRGDMSIVGPRPLMVRYLPRYSEIQARRHDVRPGLTGWAQVNGRNAISWTQKFEYDVYYVDNAGFLMDVRIFFKTIRQVLGGRGISAEGEATMPEFMGDSEEGEFT